MGGKKYIPNVDCTGSSGKGILGFIFQSCNLQTLLVFSVIF